MPEELLVNQSIRLDTGELNLLQPQESAELPDDGPVEWAPIAPYWSVLWRSGVALAREVDREGCERAPRGGARVWACGAEHRRCTRGGGRARDR